MSKSFVPSARAGVVLLGGVHGALAAARSLGRKGIPVVLVTDDHPLPKLSRYVTRAFAWPGPREPNAVRWLQMLAETQGLTGWLLIPCADTDVRLIAENRDVLRETFRVLSLDWDTLKMVCDKGLLADLAERNGLPGPASYRIVSSAEVASLDVEFPVLLKPAKREVRNRFTYDKAWRADTRTQLMALYEEAVASVGRSDVVIQEYIPGGSDTQFSYAALWSGGQPLVEMAVRRLRQYPGDIGISSFAEVSDVPAMRETARTLLRAVRYEGLVEIDFKFDARDGIYKPLDVNPRIWAWLSLGEKAGVDFVALLFRLVVEGTSVPAGLTPSACRWMQFSRDALAAVSLMRGGQFRLRDYLSSFKGPVAWATFAWDDPLPAIAEAPIILARMLRRALSLAR